MVSPPSSFEVEFPAELESVAAARRLFVDTVEEWGLGEGVRTDGSLTVSELVANAIFHAGTVIRVRFRRLGAGVRIEVQDGDSRLPVVDAPCAEDLLANRSMTGRGLALVAAASDRWGADPGPSGKVTWAEVGTGRRRVAASAVPAFPPEAPPPSLSPPLLPAAVEPKGLVAATAVAGGGRRVHFVGVPVQLLLESSRQMWDLQREMQVVAMDGSAPDELDQVVQAGRPWMTGLDLWADRDRIRLERAAASGAVTYDYEVEVPLDVIDRIAGMAAWVRRATSAAIGRYLLTCPTSSEVSALRRWIRDEIAAQLSGSAPTPCPIKANAVTEAR